MLQRIDVPEASGIQNLNIYSGIYNYAIDPTIYETDLVDIRPQGIPRTPWDVTTKTNQANFDRTKQFFWGGTKATFEYNNGVPTIRITSPIPQQYVSIDTCTALGNWIASGTASSLAVDPTIYYQNPASLRFNLTVGAGLLTDSGFSSLGLSTYEDVGVAFVQVFIPNGATASNLTSITLKLGSDGSNYNSVTATAPMIGTFTTGQWQAVAFDFSTATQTGTPDWSAIDYAQLTFNVIGSITNFHIGSLFIALPSPTQILYQSAAVFIPTGTTTALQTITANTDTIVFNTGAYNIYVYECALGVLENMSGGMGDPMYARIQQRLGVDGQGKVVGGLYSQFAGDNPSQQLRQLGTYYDNRPNTGFGTNLTRN